VFIDDLETSAGQLIERLEEVRSRKDETVPQTGWEQYRLELHKAAEQPAATAEAAIGPRA
jgi:hypothetical protein